MPSSEAFLFAPRVAEYVAVRFVNFAGVLRHAATFIAPTPGVKVHAPPPGLRTTCGEVPALSLCSTVRVALRFAASLGTEALKPDTVIERPVAVAQFTVSSAPSSQNDRVPEKNGALTLYRTFTPLTFAAVSRQFAGRFEVDTAGLLAVVTVWDCEQITAFDALRMSTLAETPVLLSRWRIERVADDGTASAGMVGKLLSTTFALHPNVQLAVYLAAFESVIAPELIA